MSDIQLLYFVLSIYSGYNLSHLVNAMFNAFLYGYDRQREKGALRGHIRTGIPEPGRKTYPRGAGQAAVPVLVSA